MIDGERRPSRRSQHRLLLLGAVTPLKFEDLRVRLIGHFRQDQQVVATEGLCRLPLLAIFVEARKGDVMLGESTDLVFPNGRLDGSDPEFRDGFLFCW